MTTDRDETRVEQDAAAPTAQADSAAKDPVAILHLDREYWTRMVDHPRLAAFEAGRALNRLRFHLIQSQIAPASLHRRLSRRAAQWLGRLARWLTEDVRRRDAIESTITTQVNASLEGMDTERFHEGIYLLVEELNDLPWMTLVPVEDYDPDRERQWLLDSELRSVVKLLTGVLQSATPWR